MPLTAQEYRELIPIEVGDASALVTTNLTVYWEMHEGKPLYLRYLWTKLSVIDLLLGQPAIREKVNYTEDGQGQTLHQLSEHLTNMREAVLRAIKEYRGNRAPVVSEMTTTAPVASPAGWPDANSGDYRGDPNTAGGIRWRP